MATLALIGFPLSHSFSQGYFRDKFSQLGLPDWDYEVWPMEDLQDLRQRISERSDLKGFNITRPHKVGIMAHCDELSQEVQSIGAVNCVKVFRTPDGIWLKGYNTDTYGFGESLKRWYKPLHKKAIILGNGGASRAVQYVLKQMDIPYHTVVRSKRNEDEISWKELDRAVMAGADLIINGTPVGMAPYNDTLLPLNAEWITPHHHYYDLVYNPDETATMKLFTSKGAKARNGLEMLYLQADKGWEIWNDGEETPGKGK